MEGLRERLIEFKAVGVEVAVPTDPANEPRKCGLEAEVVV